MPEWVNTFEVVRGGYAVREQLKRFGWRWNGRVWFIERDSAEDEAVRFALQSGCSVIQGRYRKETKGVEREHEVMGSV